IEDFFEAAPIHTSEKLETETFRILEWLKARVGTHAHGDVIGMLLGRDGKLVQELKKQDVPASKSASTEDKKRFLSLLTGKTLIMSAEFGGLSAAGLLNPKEADGRLSSDKDD